MFEEFRLTKKSRFKVLQREPAFDGGMVEFGLLKHIEEVEDLMADGLILDDFVTEESGSQVLWREADDQLVGGELINEQADGLVPSAVVIEAVPKETVFSSHRSHAAHIPALG